MKRFKPTSKQSKMALVALLSAVTVGGVGLIATHDDVAGYKGFHGFSDDSECDRKAAQYHWGKNNGQVAPMGYQHQSNMGMQGYSGGAMSGGQSYGMSGQGYSTMGQFPRVQHHQRGMMQGSAMQQCDMMGMGNSMGMGRSMGMGNSMGMGKGMAGQAMPMDDAHAAFIQQESAGSAMSGMMGMHPGMDHNAMMLMHQGVDHKTMMLLHHGAEHKAMMGMHSGVDQEAMMGMHHNGETGDMMSHEEADSDAVMQSDSQ